MIIKAFVVSNEQISNQMIDDLTILSHVKS